MRDSTHRAERVSVGLYPRGRESVSGALPKGQRKKWEPKDWESLIQRATIQMIRWDQTHQLNNSKKWWMTRNHNGESTLTKQNGTNNTHQIKITSNYEFLHSSFPTPQRGRLEQESTQNCSKVPHDIYLTFIWPLNTPTTLKGHSQGELRWSCINRFLSPWQRKPLWKELSL